MRDIFGRSQWLVMILTLLLVLPTVTCMAAPLASHQSYRLGPNDVVRIQVYGEEDLTVEGKVDGEGNINVPLLGEVLVAGKTVSELQEYLTKRLAGGYVRTPRVTAFVSRYRNIYVSGEVKAPGGHPYEEGLSVQKAITLAGGLTDKADRENVQVLRRTKDQDEIIPVRLDSQILPDDTIVVPEGQKFYISGEVKTPGRFAHEKGLTVHKALGLAAGVPKRRKKVLSELPA